MRWFYRCISLEHTVKLPSGHGCLQPAAPGQGGGAGPGTGVSPGTGRQAPWSPRPCSLAQAHPKQGAAALSSPDVSALSWAGGTVSGLTSFCVSAFWAPPTHFRGLSSGTFGRTLTAVPGWSTRIAWLLPTAGAWAAPSGSQVPVSGAGPPQASGVLFLLPALLCRLPGVAE